MNRDFCPACRSDSICSRFQKNAYSIWACSHCGTLFVRDVPVLAKLHRIYASDAYYELPDESVERIRKENCRRLDILRAHKKGNTILDVGCVQGDLLDEAQRRGYATHGLELSLNNVNISRSKGHTVFHGDLEAYWAEHGLTNRFDVITCLDVIEHVIDPEKFLRIASTILKEDGVMILTTPNYSGVLAKVLQDKEPYMIPPEHLNFFTRGGMECLFKKSGLDLKLYLTFGRLTNQELKRVVPKYFPGFLRKFSNLFEYGIPFALLLLNSLKVGMEHEFYLTKGRERG